MRRRMRRKAQIVMWLVSACLLLAACSGLGAGGGSGVDVSPKPQNDTEERGHDARTGAGTPAVSREQELIFDPGRYTVSPELMKERDKQLSWKQDTSPITFTVFYNSPLGYEYKGWGNDPISAEIKRRTGVTLELTFATTSDNSQINTMMASGEMTDFIINFDRTARGNLIKQGFVEPLDKLIDLYAPSMWSVIPERQRIIYTEADGHLYTLANWFGDPQMTKEVKGALRANSGLVMNVADWEKLGKPPLDTLDQYKQALLLAKEKLPNQRFLVYEDGQMDQFMARLHGAGHPKTIGDDGTVHMNYRDDAYLQGIKFINGLYRDGLLNPEMFSIQKDQVAQAVANRQIFSTWGYQGTTKDHGEYSEDSPYQLMSIPQVPGITFEWQDLTGSAGGSSAMITTSNKNKERAIRFLEFMQSFEGQTLTYVGIEGEHYEWADGLIQRTPEIEEARADFTKFMQEYGMVSQINNWAASGYVDQLGYYWSSRSGMKVYKQIEELWNGNTVDEFINSALTVQAGSPEQVIEAKITDLHKQAKMKMYLAKSEQEAEIEYRAFIAEAEKIGLAQLEAAYTTRYQQLKAMGF